MKQLLTIAFIVMLGMASAQTVSFDNLFDNLITTPIEFVEDVESTSTTINMTLNNMLSPMTIYHYDNNDNPVGLTEVFSFDGQFEMINYDNNLSLQGYSVVLQPIRYVVAPIKIDWGK